MGNPGLAYIVLVESEGFVGNPGISIYCVSRIRGVYGYPGLAYIVLVESDGFMGNPGLAYIV